MNPQHASVMARIQSAKVEAQRLRQFMGHVAPAPVPENMQRAPQHELANEVQPDRSSITP
jgi:hypothetical protein